MKLKLELSASTFKKSSCIFHICAWNNHEFFKQSSIPSGFVSQPKCLGHQKNKNKVKKHLFYNTMHHFLPTQLLPFTWSSNFFCNIALNGLPDVDLGIYNENFLNHKMRCDWKTIYKNSSLDHTLSTISIPPCNHLWWPSLGRYPTSSSLITVFAPSFLPSSLKTIQPFGTSPFNSSLNLRVDTLTLATTASAMSPLDAVVM